ncbi:TonB-dependent receptor [Sphingopyxis sp.]|uniref:TonB-dependent receptor n=1 Tax=Sphingopyxis sp. TaxID=1908224 RepID=UPI002EDA68BC
MAIHHRAERRALLKLSVASLALVVIPGAARAADAAAPATAPVDAADGAGSDTIYVYGQRLSTTVAIEEKRKADNVVEVISADDLGKLPDANVADALGRVPGVSVIVNQDTGEGEYVAIRGLSGTYNAVSINGIRVAQTDPGSRDVSLNVLPPNGLAAIRVTKTLTPDQDGDAIGGTIDFRTPTAFDFKDGTIVRLYASGGFNEQARKADEPSATYQGQVDFGTRFADDRFGIFVSANYGVSHGNGQETENDGEWEPYKWRKDSEEPIDERNMHLPGIDLDYRRLKQTRYGGNFSLDFRGDTTQLYLRGQFSRQKLRGTNDLTDYNNIDTPRLTQVDEDDTALAQPEDMITGRDDRGNIYGYSIGQIVDTDGDGVITDADRADEGLWSLNGRSGVWDPRNFEFARNFETIDRNQTLGTINFGGTSQFGRLKLDYDVSYSGGERSSPNSFEVAYACGEDPVCVTPQTGIDWVSNDPRFPHASLPAYAQSVERDSSLLVFDGAELSRDKQTDKRIAARIDARYDFEGVLDYVKFGAKFTRSRRSYDYTPIWEGDLLNADQSLAESGLVDKEVTSILRGEYYYGDVFDRDAVAAAIKAAMAGDGGDGAPSETDLLEDDKRSTEKVYAAYALAHFTAGPLQAIAGGRFERRETHNEFWIDDGDESGFGTTDRGYSVFLPSVTAIYRPDDRQVYRAAIWTGYSPPEYGYISAGRSVTREPGTGEIIAISQGNPDLKAARSINADLSAEYYIDRSSMISAGLFYKHIKNFIFTNGSQVDAPTQSGRIEITQPQNGETAEIYGLELNLIKSFEGLAAPFDGFGFEGNVTVQHSAASTGQPYRNGAEIRFINTPHLLYNASLTYQKYGIEAKLSYNYRGKFIESLRDNAVDKWVRPNRSLDLHTRYNFTSRFAVDFDVSNLLNDYKYYTTKGDNPTYMKDYMEAGRTFLLRGSYIF